MRDERVAVLRIREKMNRFFLLCVLSLLPVFYGPARVEGRAVGVEILGITLEKELPEEYYLERHPLSSTATRRLNAGKLYDGLWDLQEQGFLEAFRIKVLVPAGHGVAIDSREYHPAARKHSGNHLELSAELTDEGRIKVDITMTMAVIREWKELTRLLPDGGSETVPYPVISSRSVNRAGLVLEPGRPFIAGGQSGTRRLTTGEPGETAGREELLWMLRANLPGDEASAVRQGQRAYWSSIADGRGSCTVMTEQFAADNPEVPRYIVKEDYDWVFAGSRMRYRWKREHFPEGAREGALPPGGALYEATGEILFDGARVTAGAGRNYVLREPTETDFIATRSWDPRLVATGSSRKAPDWEPVFFWREGTTTFVGIDELDGYRCYLLETVIEHDWGQTIRRSWVDPGRNYCLVKSEAWVFPGDMAMPGAPEWLKDVEKWLVSSERVELVKYGEGLWGPGRKEQVVYAPDTETGNFYITRRLTTTYDEGSAYNLGLAEEEVEIILPRGAVFFDAFQYPVDYVKPGVEIEFRVAADAPRPGFTPSEVPGAPGYLSDTEVLTNADIEGVKPDFSIQDGFPRISVLFTAEGARKFAEITRDNIGERMALIVDGRLQSMPVIRQEISGGKALISGRLTEADIRRIIGAD